MTAFRTTLLAMALAAAAAAHEIPSEAAVRLIAKPGGERFEVLARVPLSTMRDVEVPTFGPGYLDVEALAPGLPALAETWIAPFVEVYQDGERLPRPRVAAVQLSILSDRSFASFEQAAERVRQPPPESAERLIWEQLHFDVLLEYAIRSEEAELSIRPRLEHLADRVFVSLMTYSPAGEVRSYQLSGDPGPMPLEPTFAQAAWRFGKLGFEHILDGPDHLLFLACLVIPFRRLRSLALIVTAFTVAHSITLIASALGFAPDALWFPPLVETLIAASIVYMAVENVLGFSSARRRWVFAFGFGLVHGFGFAFALRETLQFAGDHLMASLLAFNAGVEVGQLLVIALLAPLLEALFRFGLKERPGVIVLSAFVAHTGWHWLTERFAELRLYEIEGAALRGLAAWALAAAIAAGGVWYALARRGRAGAVSSPQESSGRFAS